MNPGSAFVRASIATLFVILDVLSTLIFVWVILSWFTFFAGNSSFRWRHRKIFLVVTQIEEMLSRLMSPLLRPFRRLLPPWKTGGLDISPMLLLLVIFFLRYFLTALVYG